MWKRQKSETNTMYMDNLQKNLIAATIKHAKKVRQKVNYEEHVMAAKSEEIRRERSICSQESDKTSTVSEHLVPK